MRRVVLLLVVAVAALAAPALASARPPETYTWCGTDETQQNRVPDLELSRAEQVRLVYAIPSDGADNFKATVDGMVNDAAWIDQWWQAQDPTRTPRFDRYPFAGCTSTWGQLDIGFLRLPHDSAYYATPDSPSIVLDNDLQRVFPATQKTIVYYDGPTKNKQICGETDYLANTFGGDNGIVYIFPQSNCHLTPIGSGASAEVAAHELVHNLGAVPDNAPNECPSPNGGHACDSTSDIMYPFLAHDSTLDSVVLDFNHDDYYGHSSSWWDVQDSDWLEHLPQYTFSAAVEGPGTISARANTLLLPCLHGCDSIELDNGTAVSVIAVPASGFAFSSWSGSCTGTAPACTVSMSAASTVTAHFVKAQTRAAVSISGSGMVTSSPAGLSCPGLCTKTFGTSSVRLTARPSPGWKLKRWSGACQGSKACVLSASGSVRAVFARR